MGNNCIEQAGQKYIVWFYENNVVDKDNLPPTRGEFINKLLTDDEFYQKWGNDCCETMTDEERVDWMRNNKTKTILPMRDPNVEFTMDEFFRPYGVPKRKLKEE